MDPAPRSGPYERGASRTANAVARVRKDATQERREDGAAPASIKRIGSSLPTSAGGNCMSTCGCARRPSQGSAPVHRRNTGGHRLLRLRSAAHPRRRRGPAGLGLVCLDLHRSRLLAPEFEAATRRSCRDGESDPRARSTRNGPQHSSRRPTSERPRTTRRLRRHRAAAHHFSPERRSPAGANGTSGTCGSAEF